MIHGHGGNTLDLADRLGCPVDEIIDMSSNINPFGPPPGVIAHLSQHLDRIRSLPEVDARRTVERFAAHAGIPADQIVAGNGTTQLIYDLPRALPIQLALIVGPTYADYRDSCRQSGIDSAYWLTRQENNFVPDLTAIEDVLPSCDAVFLCNPNNPTGTMVDGEDLRRLGRNYPETIFIVDESYLPFVTHSKDQTLIRDRPDNVLILHSMSKIFRIPGLRIGFLVGNSVLIEKIREFALPWRVNSLALEAVNYLLSPNDVIVQFIDDTRKRLTREKEMMSRRLAEIPGLRVFPSDTGFFLVRLPEPFRSEVVCDQMAQEKILIRDCANFQGLSNRFLRISLQDREKNRFCAEALDLILNT